MNKAVILMNDTSIQTEKFISAFIVIAAEGTFVFTGCDRICTLNHDSSKIKRRRKALSGAFITVTGYDFQLPELVHELES